MARILDFRERTKLRRAIYAKPTILILGALLFLVAHGAWGMYEKSLEAKAKYDKAADDLAELKEREQELAGDIEQLSTDRGIEAEIRDRFMVAKEGENVIIISKPEEEKVHTVTVPNSPDESVMKKMMTATGLSDE